MPGKKQLQKFSDDVLKIGDEVKVRAARGEKPAVFPVPPETPDVDDSQDFVLGMPDPENESHAVPNSPDGDDIPVADAADSVDSGSIASGSDDFGGGFDIPIPGEGGFESDIPDLSDILNSISNAGKTDEPEVADLPDSSVTDASAAEPENLEPLEVLEDLPEAEQVPEVSEIQDDFAMPETGSVSEEPLSADNDVFSGDFGLKLGDEPLPNENNETPAAESTTDDFGLDDLSFDEPAADDVSAAAENESEAATETPSEETAADDFGLDDLNFDEPAAGDVPAAVENESDAAAETPAAEAAADDFGLDDLSFDEPAADDVSAAAENESDATAETPAVETAADDFGLDDLNIDEPATGEIPSATENESEVATETPAPEDAADDFGLDDLNFDEPAAGKIPSATENESGSALDDNPVSESEETPLGDVDLSALEDMDFGTGASEDSGASFEDIDIKDTDENFGSSGEGDDFELGGDDDFLIPGFSDTLEADFDKPSKKEVNPVAMGQAAAASGAAPRDNKLTEEDYEKFKKNLARYPLNVKIAIEEMIVNNDFTEDVIFEVIEKVIKKTQARQLAIYLEKILDISLPVPRDFENRTVEEYEAYKASFEYQLKNKIIPITLISIGLGLIGAFMFMCGKHYIYRPLMAEHLYRQGYSLLQADEYPQSEQKFKEAVRYRNSKKWFYKFARGYREHKQYERAAVMYDDILKRFKNDKAAGLEYAQMEWQDLSNYEGAVRLLNERMLLYHVNDPDGLLELGDIYLDWADNGETAMYENARINYATLINLYGGKDLYMSRMMRYFIRTDNLREVLQLKEIFYPRKKSLDAQDLTELSGYMFDKMTSKLSADEAYLKDKIEDVKALMERAINADPSNPTALYNMARYYINMSNINGAVSYLDAATDAFKKMPRLKKADVYRQIDSYRLKGELLVKQKEIIKAVETFTEGISTFKAQTPALQGNHIVGKLYADMADIDYFNFNNTDSAYEYYKAAIENDNDTPYIRYKIGAIQYEKGSFHEAMGSFMATAEFVPEDNNLLMALGNVLINRNSYSAAKGYYERLVGNLDVIRSDRGILMPQVDIRDQDVVDMYMKAANNLGVTMYHLAKRTGNSNLNAQAIINFTESLRAWDALTRNQETLKRLPGTNLAQENIQYVLKPALNYEPAIYPDIPRTLSSEEKFNKK